MKKTEHSMHDKDLINALKILKDMAKELGVPQKSLFIRLPNGTTNLDFPRFQKALRGGSTTSYNRKKIADALIKILAEAECAGAGTVESIEQREKQIRLKAFPESPSNNEEPEQILARGKTNSSDLLSIEHLYARSTFISRVVTSVAESQSFRAQITGPFFCHPNYYFQLKAPDLQYPDLDKAIRDKLLSMKHRTSNVRLIISNSSRYVNKVKERVPPADLSDFFERCRKNVDKIWGEDKLSGPDLCCAFLGSTHISYIFDGCVLIQHRKTPMTPTEGGEYLSSQEFVEIERNRFDSIFDNTTEGQSKEISKLKEFFAQLAEENE